jgi:hypothetical protein
MGTRMPSRSSRMMALRHMRTAGEAPSVRKMCCGWMGGAGRSKKSGRAQQGHEDWHLRPGEQCRQQAPCHGCLLACPSLLPFLDDPLCPNADRKLLLLLLGVLKGLLEGYHPLLTRRRLHKALLTWSLPPAAAAGASALLHAASWCCRCLQAPAAPAFRPLHSCCSSRWGWQGRRRAPQ